MSSKVEFDGEGDGPWGPSPILSQGSNARLGKAEKGILNIDVRGGKITLTTSAGFEMIWRPCKHLVSAEIKISKSFPPVPASALDQLPVSVNSKRL